MCQSFKTHTGEIVSGDRLRTALNKVANDWAENARAIRIEDAYGSHITEEQKNRYLAEGLAFAETIREGVIGSFTIWQRVNTALTGECVGLLGNRVTP